MISTKTLFLSLLGLAVCAAEGIEKKMAYGGYEVKILGTSGKISIMKTPPENTTVVSGEGDEKPPAPKPIVLAMESLTEVDADGETVGKTGSVKHSFPSFASQDFTFGDIQESYTVGDTTAMKLGYSGTLSGLTSQLEVDVLLIKEDGKLDLAGEMSELKKGQMKFSIKLSSWMFCDPCNDGTGAFIDLVISVKSKSAPKEEKSRQKGKPAEFDLGDGELYLSQKMQIDGEWTDMADGYPKYSMKGAASVFTFRFPRFNTTAFYDPTVSVEGPDGPSSGATTGRMSIAAILGAILVAAMLNRRY